MAQIDGYHALLMLFAIAKRISLTEIEKESSLIFMINSFWCQMLINVKSAIYLSNRELGSYQAS